MKIFGMIFLIMDLGVLVNSYSIDYFDCRTPKGISRYDVSKACNEERMNDPTKHTYYLLQNKRIKNIVGYSCKVIKSSFLFYCGAFSHQKIAEIPKIELTQELTRMECQSMIQSHLFQTLEGTKHKVRINTENIFSVTEKGMIKDQDNAVSCQGETVKIHNEIFDNIVMISQYKVTLLDEEYIVENNKIENLRDHITLDTNLRSGGIFTNGQFYMWNYPKPRCTFEKIIKMKLEKEDGFLIDHENKILLNVTSPIPSAPNCPRSTIYPTEYKDFFITQNPDYIQSVDILRITDFVSNRDNYLAFVLEKKIQRSGMKMQRNMCIQVYRDNKIIPFGTDNSTFAKVEGDLLMTFRCKPKVAKIRIAPECYEDIPIQEDEGFVNPRTRIYQKHSAVIPCNAHFPLTISTREGWIQISNKILPVHQPMDKMFIEAEVEHEDLSHGGIYTQEETDSWNSLIEYSNFHKSISQQLSYGACQNLGECTSQPSSQFPSYNLQKLIDETEETVNVFKRIDQTLTKYGAYISAFVLIIWTIKSIIFMVTLTMMILQEGMTGAVALLFATCCGSVHRQHRIREIRKNLKPRPFSKDYEETSFLSTPAPTPTYAPAGNMSNYPN